MTGLVAADHSEHGMLTGDSRLAIRISVSLRWPRDRVTSRERDAGDPGDLAAARQDHHVAHPDTPSWTGRRRHAPSGQRAAVRARL